MRSAGRTRCARRTSGAPTYTYSFCGQELSTAAAPAALAGGEHQVRMEFAYDGGGPGKGGTATLYVDGERVAYIRVGRTHISLFTFDETTDVGRDSGAPVTSDHPALDNGFTGAIKWIRIDLGDDSHDHLISPETHFAVAMPAIARGFIRDG